MERRYQSNQERRAGHIADEEGQYCGKRGESQRHSKKTTIKYIDDEIKWKIFYLFERGWAQGCQGLGILQR